MTTQKASVAKMSLLIFITEPKSWGFSPIQLNLVFEKKSIIPTWNFLVWMLLLKIFLARP
jgi:hypothetical protein